jgi:hypothetical protein
MHRKTTFIGGEENSGYICSEYAVMSRSFFAEIAAWAKY